MSITANDEMCVYCFDVLLNHLDKKTKIAPPTFSNDDLFNILYILLLLCFIVFSPIFITWNKDGRLRGCIGIIFFF